MCLNREPHRVMMLLTIVLFPCRASTPVTTLPMMIVSYVIMTIPMMIVAMVLCALVNIFVVNGRSVRSWCVWERTTCDNVYDFSSHCVWALMYTVSVRVPCAHCRFVPRIPILVHSDCVFFFVVFIFSFHHSERRSEIVCETNIVILINTICETAFSLPHIFKHHTIPYHAFRAHITVCSGCSSLFCYTKRWIIYS